MPWAGAERGTRVQVASTVAVVAAQPGRPSSKIGAAAAELARHGLSL